MLSDIRAQWPPENHPTVGYKQMIYHGPAYESLDSLHDPAWWTGFRISSPTYEGKVPVRLLKRDGTPAFPTVPNIRVSVGDWTPFPWPIPAKMATEMGLYLEVPSLDRHVFSLRVSFQEMTHLHVKDRYLFVEDGKIHHVWDGRRKAWGNRTEGAFPVWRTVHTLVPPMARLVSDPVWNNDRPFCIHDWDEPVPIF